MGFDQHLVAGLGELADSGGCNAHPALMVFDFFRDSNQHRRTPWMNLSSYLKGMGCRAARRKAGQRIGSASARQRFVAFNRKRLRCASRRTWLPAAYKYGVVSGLNAAVSLRIHQAHLARVQREMNLPHHARRKMNPLKALQRMDGRKPI